MKRVLLAAIIMVAVPTLLIADGKKKTTKTATTTTEKGPAEIHWITSIDELQAKMAKTPKKVYMDVYTGWCGW